MQHRATLFCLSLLLRGAAGLLVPGGTDGHGNANGHVAAREPLQVTDGDSANKIRPNPWPTGAALAPRASSAATAFEDLASISSSQVSLGASGNYPRLAWRSDGTLVASYTAGSTTRTLETLQSTDQGKSFSALGSIASSTGDLDNCFLLEVPMTIMQQNAAVMNRTKAASTAKANNATHAILAAYRNHDLDASGAYTFYRISLSISCDGGATWTSMGDPVTGAASDTNQGYWEPYMRVGSAGEMQLSYSFTTAADDQVTMRTLSYDGGATWSTPTCLVCHTDGYRARDGMQSIVEATDHARDGAAALVIVYETETTGTFSVQAAVSYDDGATWGERMTVYAPAAADTNNAGAPQISVFMNGGALCVLFMTDEDVAAADVAWPDDASVKAVVSDGLRDGTLAWTDRALVSGALSSWPGILNLTSDSIMGVYADEGRLVGNTITREGTGRVVSNAGAATTAGDKTTGATKSASGRVRVSAWEIGAVMGLVVGLLAA